MQIRSGSQTTGHFDVFIPINVDTTDLQFLMELLTESSVLWISPNKKTDHQLIINIISEPQGTY